MYPIAKAGDIVCYKKTIPEYIIWGEMYLIDLSVADDEILTIKWVHKSEKGDGFIKLVSENKHHGPIDVSLDQIRAIALIKASIRYHTLG